MEFFSFSILNIQKIINKIYSNENENNFNGLTYYQNNLQNIISKEKSDDDFKKDVIYELLTIIERMKRRYNNKLYLNSNNEEKSLFENLKYSNVDSTLFSKMKIDIILKTLSNSINNGSLLTKRIYIRKEIWHQSSAKIKFISQKYDSFNLIYNKIDGLITLCNGNVIVLNNFDKFIDIIIDIQNSFSSELLYIKPHSHNFTSKEVITNSFIKKFSNFSVKLKTNLFSSSSKIGDFPDYLEIVNRCILKFLDLNSIYYYLRKQYSEEILFIRISIIISFFNNFLLKILLYDLKEMTNRFLKKKFLSFENR